MGATYPSGPASACPLRGGSVQARGREVVHVGQYARGTRGARHPEEDAVAL